MTLWAQLSESKSEHFLNKSELAILNLQLPQKAEGVGISESVKSLKQPE
jgi:hypothetical protein